MNTLAGPIISAQTGAIEKHAPAAPATLVPLVGPDKTTIEQAVKLAIEAGLDERLSVPGYCAAADLGAFLQRRVMSSLGETVLIQAHHETGTSIKQCDTLLAKPGIDTREAISLLNRKQALIKQHLEVARTIFGLRKSGPTATPTAEGLTPSFGQRERVMPAALVQVNVSSSATTGAENSICHTKPGNQIPPQTPVEGA